MKIFLTGAAGFIGSHATRALLDRGHEVLGVDNLNAYYDPALKRARLDRLEGQDGFRFAEQDIADADAIRTMVAEFRPQRIVHLAAQAGVRYSLENPMAYVQSNLVGHVSVLEAARHCDSVEHLVYASSSSVYGERDDAPFGEDDPVNAPVSLYAATKRADELISATYSRLYDIPQTGLRFFTVYGPWGRPDMAYWSFTDAILRGQPIRLFNEGRMERDFTFIDDVIETAMRIVDDTPSAGSHRVYNIGGSDPRPLAEFITALEAACGRKAITELAPMQAGDVTRTAADVTRIKADYGYAPSTRIEDGLSRFVSWYRNYSGL
ncbi:NAD-dependent epimerase/dehydratase family protein [Hyphobacterium marinum]|uniref:NAD-dependent epimerase/dehydratase family protein n=1 Tax=Hyphobacterium marinum TaxID=3116574 RepID=A0ABU7LY33_9PROT|nr:NAD-dependent epimerase/dehydratase family protein [Hyphobacterium sp. Y6023]MEE2566439.1 NAD-dependent epimerase/dehydratase family protein [Hyphobacterium sp. Y6023]